jgi:YEATS domain-containing protein 4
MPASGQHSSAEPQSQTPAPPDNKQAPSQTARRLTKTAACLPIVYGSVAFYLGKKADEYRTHVWTLFVRGPNNEDLSGVVSKVVFQLHASFTQPIREILAPPFEVTECGWGEFEAQIRIIWKEASERPTLVSS